MPSRELNGLFPVKTVTRDVELNSNNRMHRSRGSTVFWSTWCGFCMTDLPHEVELANRYESAGLRVIGVNADEDLETAKRAVIDKSIPWLNLYEGKEQSISNQLGITSWPVLFLLDSNGTVVATTDMLRRTSFVTMPDGAVQSVYRLDTFIAKLLEPSDK